MAPFHQNTPNLVSTHATADRASLSGSPACQPNPPSRPSNHTRFFMPPQAPRAILKSGFAPPNAPGHGHGPNIRHNRSFGHGGGPGWPGGGPNRNLPQNQNHPLHPRAPPKGPQISVPREPIVHIIIGDNEPFRGPIPGRNVVPAQYLLQQHIRKETKMSQSSVQNEEVVRIQGIQAIDKVRKALHLPVRTFDTAACYFHRSRLTSPENNWYDAAMAALFVSCKVEDTMKKSRDILCAAHNLKSPEHPIAPDDKSLERPSANIIALERTILETIGFNFRVRHPQRHLVKVCRSVLPKESSTEFFGVAYQVLMDMYKTLIPIKQDTYTMALAALEVTARVLKQHIETIQAIDLQQLHVVRGDVVETFLDLLDLYTQHHKLTLLGTRYDLDLFLNLKISINGEVDVNPALDRYASRCPQCDGETNLSIPAPPSLGDPLRINEDTTRFLFSAERSKIEAAEVDRCMRDEYEEYEEETEVPIEYPPPGPGPGNGPGRRNRDRARHGHGPPSGPAAHDGHWHPYAKERGRRGGGRKMH